MRFHCRGCPFIPGRERVPSVRVRDILGTLEFLHPVVCYHGFVRRFRYPCLEMNPLRTPPLNFGAVLGFASGVSPASIAVVGTVRRCSSSGLLRTLTLDSSKWWRSGARICARSGFESETVWSGTSAPNGFNCRKIARRLGARNCELVSPAAWVGGGRRGGQPYPPDVPRTTSPTPVFTGGLVL